MVLVCFKSVSGYKLYKLLIKRGIDKASNATLNIKPKDAQNGFNVDLCKVIIKVIKRYSNGYNARNGNNIPNHHNHNDHIV